MKQLGEATVKVFSTDDVILNMPIQGGILHPDNYNDFLADMLTNQNYINGAVLGDGNTQEAIASNLPYDLAIDSDTPEVVVNYQDLGNTNEAYRLKVYLVCDVIETDS